MGVTCCKIRLRKSLEVHTIVCEQSFVLTNRIRQLLGIAVTALPCLLGMFLSRRNRRVARAEARGATGRQGSDDPL